MKKLARVLISLGFCCAVLGIIFSMLLLFTPLQLVFFKHFLVEALKENGYEVRWERVELAEDGTFTMGVSPQPPKRKNAKILHLGEYGNRLWVFIEKSRSVDGTGKFIISGTEEVLPWPDLSALHQTFPFREIQQIGERTKRFKRDILISTLVSCFSLMLAGEVLGRIAKRYKKKRAGKKKIFVPKKAHLPTPILDTKPSFPLSLPVEPRPVIHEQVSIHEREIDQEWTRLLDRVRQEMELVQGEVKDALEDEFVELLVETRPSRRVRKALHLLSKMEKLREVISQSSQTDNESDRSVPPPAPPIPSLESVLQVLLPIDEYVPLSLNPEIVRRVILTFLRLGNKATLVEARYTSLENLHKWLRGVPEDERDESIRWLTGIGVLMERRPHRKAGRTFVSLRIRAGNVPSPGKEIIRIIARAAYEKARMG